MSTMIGQIIDYLENRLIEEINYDNLYQEIGYSKYHLTREFKTKTGFTISEYFLKRRLSEAAVEIVTSSQKIINIAFKYGFNSDTYFSRKFKKEFDLSPKEYRNRQGFIVITNRIIIKEGIKMKYSNKEDLINDLLMCSSTEELKGFFTNKVNCILTKQENSQLEIVYIEYSDNGKGRLLRTLHLNMITGLYSVINIYQITDIDGPMVEMNNLHIEDEFIVLDFIDNETNKTSTAKLERIPEKKINCKYSWRSI